MFFNNSLLLRGKTFFSFLELIDHVFSISEYVLEKLWLLSILIKNLRKALHKELCDITCQKTFLACILQLIKCFQLQDMTWKTEECRVSKTIKLKIWW